MDESWKPSSSLGRCSEAKQPRKGSIKVEYETWKRGGTSKADSYGEISVDKGEE